ncbi:centromere protein H isoform X2 [Excalfactoria chinensis]|uniref:centromere protein H isoform X2 n=1 Tax=Excalfactoria chinensis TaxID=46218 RepID=UPI003B3A8904
MAERLTDPNRPGPSAEAAADPIAKRDVLKHLCVKTQLEQLVMEFSTACHQDEDCNKGVEVNFTQSAKESLEEVDKVKTAFESKALALKRIQLMDALRKKLKQSDDCARLIMKTMRDIISLNWKILQAHQQAHVIREDLNDIRRKRHCTLEGRDGVSLAYCSRTALDVFCLLINFGMLCFAHNGTVLKHKGVKAAQIFTTMRKKREVVKLKITDKLKFIHRNLQHEKKVTTLIQNILQNIVVGCQINWAKDPSLKAVILQAEKDFTIRKLL